MRYVRILFAPPLLAASIAFAGEPWIVSGRVVGISDGDTITVLDRDHRQHKIRLAGIDAPEKGQAFGERSRQSLAQMAHGKDARLDCHKTDRFGREVCKVWVQPVAPWEWRAGRGSPGMRATRSAAEAATGLPAVTP